MDLGAVTLIVAITFAGIGIVVGFIISKLISAKESSQQDLSTLKERIEGLTDRINGLVEEIKEKLKRVQSERIEEIRSEFESLLSEVERLKRELHQLDLSESSIEAIERTESLLQEVEFNLPKVDESLLTQVKDSLLILRNDVENLMLKLKEKAATPPSPSSPCLDPSALDSVLGSISSAIELSKRLNTLLVKGELTALANSFKNEELTSLVKELDDQALNSKELVVLLEEVKKKLEEVRNEASLRR